DKDAKASHDTTLETQKVDLEVPAQSRLYQRLENENHQCWGNYKENAAEMLKAIEQWATVLKKAPTEEETPLNQTTKLLLKDVVDSQAEFSIPTLLFEAESAILTPNGFVVGDDAARSGGKYIGIVEAGQPLVDVADPNIAKAEYKFTVTVAGKYYFWGLVNAPDGSSDSFYIAMNNGAARRWNIATGNLETWKWELARAEDAQVMEFDLAVGEHTLVLYEREDGTKIDKIAITMSTDFSEESSQSVKILRYDVSKMAGAANVFFTIEVKTFNDDSYLFRNPSIVTRSGQFKVKKIDLLLNGQANPNNATYQLVDEVVTAEQGLLSSAAMVVLMDKGVDKDQFAFEFEAFELLEQ
ncbi:MAG: hypothetical protein KBD78_17175, partial [Oligoflexales bacterium]|nr:hypothetical protein [Oligoflexales bacterium]